MEHPPPLLPKGRPADEHRDVLMAAWSRCNRARSLIATDRIVLDNPELLEQL